MHPPGNPGQSGKTSECGSTQGATQIRSILQTGETLLRRQVVDLTLLGNPEDIRQKISGLGLNLEEINIVDPLQSELLEEYAMVYYGMRKHKGISEKTARDTVTDVSYFGTMMGYKGAADGMVSGAVHTTGETIGRLTPLAPLHNPANLLGINVALASARNVPQVAVCDTAFHQSIPPHAYRYALSQALYEHHGVRRYGFHGTSHFYVAKQAAIHLKRSLTSLNELSSLHSQLE
jgi:hypothetical protein